MAAVVEMVSAGTLPDSGFLAQESIDFAALLRTRNGSFFAGRPTP